MFGNWALQFGAARLPGVTRWSCCRKWCCQHLSVLIAHAEQLSSARTLAGGALIMGAALLATLGRAPEK